MKILFVCKGNTGRSQMAEAIFNKLADGKHLAYSCGTKVYDHEGKSKHGQKIKEVEDAGTVIASLKELGLDVSDSQRDQIMPEMIKDVDKIVVMAEMHTLPDFLIASNKVVYWDIENPKGMDQEGTNRVRDQITDKVRGLLTELGGKGKLD